MKKVRLKKPIVYRGFTIKEENDYLVLYDTRGNYVKRNPNFNHGSLTDLKQLVDVYIAEGNI